ncbi:hypothetical protein D3C72_2401440 [compost metagenome]
MCIGPEGTLFDLSQELDEGRIAREVCLQGQRVHEEADHGLDLLPVAVGDGASHHHLILPAVA